MKKILLIAIVLLGLIVGCGSEKSDNEPLESENIIKDNNGTTIEYSEEYNVALKYDYNQDKSAIQKLLPLHVNRYKEVQSSLNLLQANEEAFSNHYDWYVNELISTQIAIDRHPSYAPRGKSKSLIVTVKNKKIDYSSYRLIGDINDDGEVDFDDEEELKEAITNGYTDSKYDVNSDGSIDIKDTVNLLSRIGTEIKSFDFYTLQGKKLNIPSRNFSDKFSVEYSGTESKVMVVAKDSNGVSGFTSGLSDIDTLWYIGLSEKEKLEVMEKEEGMEATNPERIALVKEALKFIKQTPKAYLLGWKVSIKFSTTDSFYLELDKDGLKDMDAFYFASLEDKIRFYFKDTSMSKEERTVLEKNRYIYHIGLGKYEKEEGVDGAYEFDLVSGSFDTHVKAYRKTLKSSTIVNGKKVYIKNMVHVSSVIFTSKADKILEGTVTKEGVDVKEGEIEVKRVGPDPKDEEYKGAIGGDSKYKLKNIPFGTYKVNYIDKCQCTQLLEEEYLFKKNENKDFDFHKKEVKVKLTVRDNDKNLLKGKNVRIEPDECMVEETIFSDVSDDNAHVKFNQVPIGKYKVYVDNTENGIIQVCSEFDGEVLGEKLWNIDAKFTLNNPNPNLRNYEWHWKNIKIGLPNEPISTYHDYFSYLANQQLNQTNKQPPFPSKMRNGYLLLFDTEAYFGNESSDNSGMNLYYMKDEYCLMDSSFLDDIYIFDTGVRFLPLACGDYGKSANTNFIFDEYDLALTPSEVQSLKDYKTFTFTEVGDNHNQGTGGTENKGTITITFTPSH